MLSEHACLLVHNKQAGWLSHLLLNRDVTTGGTFFRGYVPAKYLCSRQGVIFLLLDLDRMAFA